MSTNEILSFLSKYSLQILLAWLAAYLLMKQWGGSLLTKRFLYLSAAGYGLVLLYMTLLSRQMRVQMHYQLEFLWEYRLAFQWEAGRLKIQDMEYAWYIANNILLFVPMGVLLSEFLGTCGSKKLRWVLPAACLASALLEVSQLVFRIGLFELDDILNNSVGAILGLGLYMLAQWWKKNRQLRAG